MTRSVAQKMGVSPGQRAFFSDAPDAAIEAIDLPELAVSPHLRGAFDLIIAFFATAQAMRDRLPALKKHLAPGGRLWACWRKGRAGGSDLVLTKVIEIAYDHGLVESTALSIDEHWSGLKLTWSKPGKTYANSYGKLPDQR